uniref:Uncharacterized protein n=1 Tax=uncultured bacterium contig00023 TaxID=1181512 RepID=A0A806KDA5_9BACT|nr:hypothetical protein [uncultured bacterium contig00023]
MKKIINEILPGNNQVNTALFCIAFACLWKVSEEVFHTFRTPPPLLGVIPLEFMDLMVNPVTQQLEGVHGDQAILMVM